MHRSVNGTPLIAARPPARERDVQSLFQAIENIHHYRELDALLEAVLSEARSFVHADAGTLYLERDSHLYFSYVQNDTLLAKESVENIYVYSQASLPVNKESLAGYVALTGEALLIDDVYDIRSNVDFSFNPAFDTKTGYKTVSLLIAPLKTREGVTVGVLQLINAKDGAGRVIAFSEQDRLFVLQFAESAADQIARARLAEEMVLRMVELAELRDPYETGAHAQRVGAYSAELYELWARKHGTAETQLRDTKQVLKTAAMLHDVGKVAVSDSVLRKPSELTNTERYAMRMHTIYGARLFGRQRSVWDRVALEVVLNHHERWDGKGYPGQVPNIFASNIHFGRGKVGAEIPITARIVSIVDVYDALVSDRAYKEGWDSDIVYVYIGNQSGKQFDPELVELFLTNRSFFASIGAKYAH